MRYIDYSQKGRRHVLRCPSRDVLAKERQHIQLPDMPNTLDTSLFFFFSFLDMLLR